MACARCGKARTPGSPDRWRPRHGGDLVLHLKHRRITRPPTISVHGQDQVRHSVEHRGSHPISQLNGCGKIAPLRWHGPTDVHDDLPAPREPLVPAQDRARAAHGHRQNRDASLRSNQERPEMESEETRPACQRALREGDDPRPVRAASSWCCKSSTPPLGSMRRTNKVPMRRRNGPATRWCANSSFATKDSGPGMTAAMTRKSR